ncbi:MAG: PSD1 and planctomycete cytochrome C domain-containing protein [Candidatus Sulfopaludibacter sp.]|nr:PSD1 and planctomycete cytochrome C domain-containing protein [Candidatus Sulfopaludibacter sp.]
MRKLLRLAIPASLIVLAVPGLRPAGETDFAGQIQPVFAESCYACHGPKVQMGGLRLDARPAGKFIVPGDSANSLIIQRVTSSDTHTRMPLGGPPLAPEKIELLRQWIDAGAIWPEVSAAKAPDARRHWAFVAPVRPAVPHPATSEWARNPIDAFVLQKLEKEGLKPSPEADRATLLRRLSLDLVGLPPTPAELDAFLADRSSNAYEKQVDRLLASPHYGERWGRVWLDAARYADSNGYEKDAPRLVWFYRDWVIHALNRDLPYNEFVIEQIAGDLLPNATQDQKVATGFLRNSMINEEGGVDPEQFRMEAMYDRMDAIGKGILGVTIQCAQCHNHKYDPLSQEEYYRMFAFLNDTDEANVAVYTPAQQQKRAAIFQRTEEIEAQLQHRNPGWQKRMAVWEERVRSLQPEWRVLSLTVDDISTGGERELRLKDDSMLAQGYAPTKHTVEFTAKTDLPRIAAVRLELLTDPNLPNGGPGRSLKGTGALTEFLVDAAPAGTPDKFTKVKIARATADINLPETPLEPKFDDKSGKRRVTGPIEFAIDGKDETAWGTDAGPGLRNQPRKAVFQFEQPVTNPNGTILRLRLKQNHGGWNSDDNENNNLGRIRLSITSAPDAVADPLPRNVRDILSIPREQRSPAQVRAVFSYWRTTVAEWKAENDAIAALWREHPEGALQLVLADRSGDHRQTHILKRGDFLQPERAVEPGTPAFLHPLPADAPRTRLTFAKWLVDRRSPTTARSLVNRIWQAYFGTGIVATAENLGTQAEPPSNQELLDWLAVEFMDSGWSLKKLHRLIVTSSVYRQSSNISPELLAQDPDNRLLARGPRFRVDAEIVRDIALAASGLLNPEVGGPSVYPPAPAVLFQPPASYSAKTWATATGPDRYRRALYTFRFRSVPFPMLQAFDAPNGEMSCVRRARSDTPLQALTTLNEPLFVESAQAMAIRVIREGGDIDRDRIAYAFRLCTARRPTPEETDVLLKLLAKEDQRIADGWLSALDLTGLGAGGGASLPAGTTPRRYAAWTAVSRVILNLDETITKE